MQPRDFEPVKPLHADSRNGQAPRFPVVSAARQQLQGARLKICSEHTDLEILVIILPERRNASVFVFGLDLPDIGVHFRRSYNRFALRSHTFRTVITTPTLLVRLLSAICVFTCFTPAYGVLCTWTQVRSSLEHIITVLCSIFCNSSLHCLQSSSSVPTVSGSGLLTSYL